MIVHDIFNVMHFETNFQIINDDSEVLWQGNSKMPCKYCNNEIVFLRVVGSPYTSEGYIEIRI